MLEAPAAHALEGGSEVSAHAQPGPSQQPPEQDGAVGISIPVCLRERQVTVSIAVFQVTGRAWAGNAGVLPLPPTPGLREPSAFFSASFEGSRPRSGARIWKPQGEGRREPNSPSSRQHL